MVSGSQQRWQSVGFTKAWAMHGVGVDPAGLVGVVRERGVMVARFVCEAWSPVESWWMAWLVEWDGSRRLVVVNDGESVAAEIPGSGVVAFGEVMGEVLDTPGVFPVGIGG